MVRTWTFGVIVGMFGVLALAGIEIRSHAREKPVELQSFRSERPVRSKLVP